MRAQTSYTKKLPKFLSFLLPLKYFLFSSIYTYYIMGCALYRLSEEEKTKVWFTAGSPFCADITDE